MVNRSQTKARISPLEHFVLTLAAVWLIAGAAVLWWEVHQEQQASLVFARSHAQMLFEKDTVYLDWVSQRRGVYVEVSEDTPRNPYLADVPERDVTAPSGRVLTLLNAMYMTRQVQEMEKQAIGVRGHLASLNPTRPEGAADAWETEALRAFARGEAEVSSLAELDGRTYLRLMRPMVLEKECLDCHAKQGYKEGDIKGGLSIAVPMEPIWDAERQTILESTLAGGGVWLLGLLGLGLGARGVVRGERKRRQAERAVLEGEERFRNLVEIARDGIIVHIDGKYAFANPAGLRILGVSRLEDLIGRPYSDCMPADYLQTARIRDARMMAGAGDAPVAEEKRLRSDGTVVDVEVAARPHVYEGKAAILVILRDISDRKRSEQNLQRTNARLGDAVSELERQSREDAQLREMSEVLQACASLEEAYPVISRYCRLLFAGWAGALYVLNPSRKLLAAAVIWGDPRASEQVFGPDECWGLRRGRVHTVKDADGLLCRHLRQAPAGGSVCVPMVAQGDILGVLYLERNTADEGPAEALPDGALESCQSLAVLVVEHLSLAVANLRLRETLRSQATRDPLTGLYNRRYMEETLEREVPRALRKAMPLTAVMLDIDHFKEFNDVFGHAAGDLLLHELGVFLQAHVRAEDVACRYGGEEFTLIVPELSAELAVSRLEELREGVKQIRVEYHGQPLGPVAVSLGVAFLPEHGRDAATLLRAADRALYRAKTEGRDRVVVAR